MKMHKQDERLHQVSPNVNNCKIECLEFYQFCKAFWVTNKGANTEIYTFSELLKGVAIQRFLWTSGTLT